MEGDRGGSGGGGGVLSPRGEGVVSSTQRQRVIDALCDHFAEDRLEMHEFEQRVDRAHRATAVRELEALLEDLPALDEGSTQGTERARAGGTEMPPEAGSSGGVGRVPASRVSESQFECAIWSGRSRAGSWIPARTIRVVACMGGVELDFREARFGSEEIRIHVVSILGGVEIIVPPGVHVDTGGFAFMGAFEEKLAGAGPIPPDAPTIRVTGFTMMGGVEVTSRLPGETGRQARRRLKDEARRRLESGDEGT